MSKWVRKHTLLARQEGPAGDAVRAWIGESLGVTEAMPVDNMDSIHVYRLEGEHGEGILAETSTQLTGDPGIYRSRTSAWLRRSDEPIGRHIEAEFHGWDAWTYAHATGDRRWIEAPRRQMYRERDRRTAQVAAELDRAQRFEIEEGSIPALLAGLDLATTRRLAIAHAPGLLRESSLSTRSG